jgi:hypothetical protein
MHVKTGNTARNMLTTLLATLSLLSGLPLVIIVVLITTAITRVSCLHVDKVRVQTSCFGLQLKLKQA